MLFLFVMHQFSPLLHFCPLSKDILEDRNWLGTARLLPGISKHTKRSSDLPPVQQLEGRITCGGLRHFSVRKHQVRQPVIPGFSIFTHKLSQHRLVLVIYFYPAGLRGSDPFNP